LFSGFLIDVFIKQNELKDIIYYALVSANYHLSQEDHSSDERIINSAIEPYTVYLTSPGLSRYINIYVSENEGSICYWKYVSLREVIKGPLVKQLNLRFTKKWEPMHDSSASNFKRTAQEMFCLIEEHQAGELPVSIL
jgi:hypothetical protein